MLVEVLYTAKLCPSKRIGGDAARVTKNLMPYFDVILRNNILATMYPMALLSLQVASAS